MPGSESREEIKVEDAWEYLEDRFGVPREGLEGFEIIKKSGDFWLTSETEKLEFEYETQGVRFIRDTGKYLKPTTYGLQLLEGHITRNKIKLTEKEFLKLLDGEMIEKQVEEKGYVALEFKGLVIGCGLYMDQVVSSRIPKGRAKELKDLI